MRFVCVPGTADVVLGLVPFDVGHSTLPSAADLDLSTLRSALVAHVQTSVLLVFFYSC